MVLVITTPTEETFEIVDSWKGSLPVWRATCSAGASLDGEYSDPRLSDVVGPELSCGSCWLDPERTTGLNHGPYFCRAEERAPNPTRQAMGSRWKSSDIMDDMKASAVWIKAANCMPSASCRIRVPTSKPAKTSFCSKRAFGYATQQLLAIHLRVSFVIDCGTLQLRTRFVVLSLIPIGGFLP